MKVLAVSVLLAVFATTPPAFAQTSPNDSTSENSAGSDNGINSEPSNSATSPDPADAGATSNQDDTNSASDQELAPPSTGSDTSPTVHRTLPLLPANPTLINAKAVLSGRAECANICVRHQHL